MSNAKLEKLATFVTTNRILRREYFREPGRILAWMAPEGAQRPELVHNIEEKIGGDRQLTEERDDSSRAERLAKIIVSNPRLRSEYFETPAKVLSRAIPRRGLVERLWPARSGRVRTLRAELGHDVEEIIDSDARLISARETYFEKNAFLNEALLNPQTTFDAIVRLSFLAFITGAALLAGAVAAAILGDGTAQKAVLGGLAGAGGAVTTLATLFAISRDAVRKVNGDNAQIRMILTCFATEITFLRALSIKSEQDARERSERIRAVTLETVKMVEEYAEPVEAREVQGQARKDQEQARKVQEQARKDQEQARKVPGQRGATPAAGVSASGQQPHDPQPPAV